MKCTGIKPRPVRSLLVLSSISLVTYSDLTCGSTHDTSCMGEEREKGREEREREKERVREESWQGDTWY